MRGKHRLAALAAASILAGCAGTASSSLPGTGVQTPAVSPAGSARSGARVLVSVRIPRRGKHARYVSINTKSIQITAKGLKATFDVTPSSPGCATAAGGTLCTFTTGVPAGKVTFTVTAYGLASAKGSKLSTGSVTKTIAAGTLAYLPLTLAGIPATATVSLLQPSPPAGTAASTSVYVTAFDASGAAIVGPGTYATPIVVKDNDTSGITSLTNATFTGPGSVGTLAYTGVSIVSASIGASASGVKITAATFAPVPTIAAAFPLNAALSGDSPVAIAGGPNGILWYTASGTTDGIGAMTTTGTGSAFVGGSGGLTAANYPDITEGPDGNMWFTENTGGGSPVDNIGKIDVATNAITEYSATGLAGTACPERIISVPADGALWFTSNCASGSGMIGRITPSGIVSTFALSGGGKRMTGIALGKDGFLYVNDRTSRAIGQVIVAGGVVTAFSERTVGTSPQDGSNNGGLEGIVQTADGTLWWTNDQASGPNTIGSLTIESPFTSSPVAQYTTVAGNSQPAYMALAPAGGQTIWVAEAAAPVIEEVSAPPGGGVPALSDFTLETQALGTGSQSMFDIVLGPDGNLWATGPNGTSGSIFKIAY